MNIQRNPDGTLDEIIVAEKAYVHLEQMSESCWNLIIQDSEITVIVNLFASAMIFTIVDEEPR